MKKLKTMIVLSVIMLAALSVMSCQKTVNVANQNEYYAGSNAGKKTAEADADKYHCQYFYNMNNPTSSKLLKDHIMELKPKYSEDYVKGFIWGYDFTYNEIYKNYCTNL